MKKSLIIGIALFVVVGIFSFAFLKGGQSNVYSIETPYGVIKVKLYDETPLHRDNFIKLVQEKKYDGTLFHRVIKGFMVQGGDPQTKDDALMSRWGMGGPGYQFDDEIHGNNRNEPGTISMANSGPNTNGSQFFINTASNNFLDSKHTVFGHVVSGMEVVSAIESCKTGQNDRPVEPMIINSISVS